MDTLLLILKALNSLVEKGFILYTRPLGLTTWEDDVVVLESSDRVMYRVLIRRAFFSDKGSPILTLNLKNQTDYYLSKFDYVLCVNETDDWLIPSAEIPRHTKSIRIGKKFESYLIQNQQDITAVLGEDFTEKLRQKLQETEETTDVMGLLKP